MLKEAQEALVSGRPAVSSEERLGARRSRKCPARRWSQLGLAECVPAEMSAGRAHGSLLPYRLPVRATKREIVICDAEVMKTSALGTSWAKIPVRSSSRLRHVLRLGAWSFGGPRRGCSGLEERDAGLEILAVRFELREARTVSRGRPGVRQRDRPARQRGGDTAISVVGSTRSVSETEMVLMRSCRRVHRRERAAIEAHRGLPSDCFPASDAQCFASSQTPQDRFFRNIRRLLPLSRNEG